MPKQKQNPEIADGFWCSQTPKQKQNPEIADGFWYSQMPKQKQNPEIADGFWCSPSITEICGIKKLHVGVNIHRNS